MKKLQDGLDIALVTDAGTPALSDPGAVLIREAREAGISVIPVPGPSALTAAVSVAGLETIGFFFGGFPPVKKGMREKFFQRLATLPYPLVFYESPRRIVSCLKLCLAVFGNRRAMLFKELTKLHENCFRGKLSEILAQVGESIRGELVLIILPHEEPNKRTPDNLRELLSWYKKQPGMSLKDAVRRITKTSTCRAEKCTGKLLPSGKPVTDPMTQPKSPREKIYFSIDRGGTFTDIYASRQKGLHRETALQRSGKLSGRPQREDSADSKTSHRRVHPTRQDSDQGYRLDPDGNNRGHQRPS
jgi:16S rRNA (cytidine(1402)-2'-O)-methyltransferase